LANGLKTEDAASSSRRSLALAMRGIGMGGDSPIPDAFRRVARGYAGTLQDQPRIRTFDATDGTPA
jgi:hypothetical protein